LPPACGQFHHLFTNRSADWRPRRSTPSAAGRDGADIRYERGAGTEGLVCLEINIRSGTAETSLAPELAPSMGFSFDELVRWKLEDASLNR
jgi:hypothetical protein